VNQESGWGTSEGEAIFDAAVRRVPYLLAQGLGLPVGLVRFLPHHISHAASCFFTSPFQKAAVLVLDGIGEDATGWLGYGVGSNLRRLEAIDYPNSLGLLWERFAVFLGFDEYSAGKVMALAGYGNADTNMDAVRQVLEVSSDPLTTPVFRVAPRIAQFRSRDVSGLERLFGYRRRRSEPATDGPYSGIARALQLQTEHALVRVAERLAFKTRANALCYSGGVALNCLANTALRQRGPFEQISMIGACHDAGTSIGAALSVSLSIDPSRRVLEPAGQRADLGPDLADGDTCRTLTHSGLRYVQVRSPSFLAAQALAEGKLVGWINGRMEFGPRALGHRSLLGDPRRREIRDRLNQVVKKREAFRPFGASVLAEAAATWFDLPQQATSVDSPDSLMLFAYPVKPSKRELIPAVVHVDGSCRIHVVHSQLQSQYHELISHFLSLTGIPLVINTSFNDQEPIVCTAEDAVKTALRSGVDVLIIGNYVVSL
jgi:carbamoyltransferase